MNEYEILKKYKLFDSVTKEFERKTINDVGQTNLVLKFEICIDHLEKEWIKFRDRNVDLIKNEEYDGDEAIEIQEAMKELNFAISCFKSKIDSEIENS